MIPSMRPTLFGMDRSSLLTSSTTSSGFFEVFFLREASSSELEHPIILLRSVTPHCFKMLLKSRLSFLKEWGRFSSERPPGFDLD